MKVENFPFKLGPEVSSLLGGLVSLLAQHEVKINSVGRAGLVILFPKQQGIPDAHITFEHDCMKLHYPLSPLAKSDGNIKTWLGQYHRFLTQSLNKGTLYPEVPRCGVTIKAFFSGAVEYYLTYMVRHEDGSLAQDTPQGLLYAKGALAMPASQPLAGPLAAGMQAGAPAAAGPPAGGRQPEEQAEWLA